MAEEHQCPTCGENFESRRGLGVHHSSVHDERLPNRQCANCRAEFFCECEKKYCSEDCRNTSVSFEGSDNPNYSGGKTTTDCEICDESFEYYESDKKGLYCPECVESEQWRHERDFAGENNPRWKGGEREVECELCGDTFIREPQNITGEVSFCSDECQYEWVSEEFTGEGHPNWEGGDTGNYGKGWNRIRRRALERDDYECVICGTDREEIGRNPDVHHIVPVRVFAEARGFTRADAHYIENVVSLCVDCHRKADFGVIPKADLLARVPYGSRYGPHHSLPGDAGKVGNGPPRVPRV